MRKMRKKLSSILVLISCLLVASPAYSLSCGEYQCIIVIGAEITFTGSHPRAYLYEYDLQPHPTFPSTCGVSFSGVAQGGEYVLYCKKMPIFRGWDGKLWRTIGGFHQCQYLSKSNTDALIQSADAQIPADSNPYDYFPNGCGDIPQAGPQHTPNQDPGRPCPPESVD